MEKNIFLEQKGKTDSRKMFEKVKIGPFESRNRVQVGYDDIRNTKVHEKKEVLEMDKIKKFDHICLAVKDLENAKKILGSFFGKTEPDISYIDEDEAIKVARYYVGDIGFELMESTREGSDVDKFISRKGEGVMLLGFEVPDVEGALKELKGKGFELIDDEPRRRSTLEYAFLHPSCMTGVLTEIIKGNMEEYIEFLNKPISGQNKGEGGCTG